MGEIDAPRKPEGGSASRRLEDPLHFSLRFDGGRGVLSLTRTEVGPMVVEHLELEIRHLAFPFDLTAGMDRLRDRWLRALRLDVTLRPSALGTVLARAAAPSSQGLAEVAATFEDGGLEVVGAVDGTEPGPEVVVRLVADAPGDRSLVLRPSLFAVLGPPVLSGPQVAVALGRLADGPFERRGLDLVLPDVARSVLMALMPPHGHRLPDVRDLGIRSFEVGPWGARIRLAERGAPRPVAQGPALALSESADLLRPGDGALAAGRPEEARREYLEALSREPGHPVVLERIAWLDATSSHGKEAARAACQRHLATADHPGLRAVLASLALERGDTKMALESFELLAPHLGRAGRARLLGLLGRLERPSSPEAAAARFEAALELAPGRVELLELLQEAYAGAGRRRQLGTAGARLVAALGSPAQRAAALTAQGLLWLDRFEQRSEAARLFEQALLNAPDHDGALLGLARCREADGDGAGALACLDAVARLAADRIRPELEAEAHLRAGLLWESTGDRVAAAARCHRAGELAPERLDVLAASARIDSALGRLELADSTLRRMAELAESLGDRDALRRALLSLARLRLEGQGSPMAAEAVLDRLDRLAPGDPEAEALRRDHGLVSPTAEQEPPPVPPPAPREPLATTPAGAEVQGLEDVEALVRAHAGAPGELAVATRLAVALERRGEWPQVVAVLAATKEAVEAPAERAGLLVRMAETLEQRMDDGASAADCLLEAAELQGTREGAELARRAASLLEREGFAEEAREAETLAERLAPAGSDEPPE